MEIFPSWTKNAAFRRKNNHLCVLSWSKLIPTSFPGSSLYLEVERGPWERGWTDTDSYLHYHSSSHPLHCKKSILNNQLLRSPTYVLCGAWFPAESTWNIYLFWEARILSHISRTRPATTVTWQRAWCHPRRQLSHQRHREDSRPAHTLVASPDVVRAHMYQPPPSSKAWAWQETRPVSRNISTRWDNGGAVDMEVRRVN